MIGWIMQCHLAKYNIRVVLGTPSAAPPAWIIEEIPDFATLDSQGRVRGLGEGITTVNQILLIKSM